jgi:hypothetical protein
VLEEADEALFWLEFIKDEQLIKEVSMSPLIDEASELKAIFYSSRKTARSNKLG